jgi:predicted nucleic acid-binding Zn ribbon protein
MKYAIPTCKVCGKELRGKQTKFCSDDCKNDFHQAYPLQRLRGLKRKLELMLVLGGKCSRCGSDKNLAALSFHHVSGKSHAMDMRNLSNRKLEAVLMEFQRCELLCLNCHAELHSPHLNMEAIDLNAYEASLEEEKSRRRKKTFPVKDVTVVQ